MNVAKSPEASYTQDDVINLAYIMTGWGDDLLGKRGIFSTIRVLGKKPKCRRK